MLQFKTPHMQNLEVSVAPPEVQSVSVRAYRLRCFQGCNHLDLKASEGKTMWLKGHDPHSRPVNFHAKVF